jgi:hypothetical protein
MHKKECSMDDAMEDWENLSALGKLTKKRDEFVDEMAKKYCEGDGVSLYASAGLK